MKGFKIIYFVLSTFSFVTKKHYWKIFNRHFLPGAPRKVYSRESTLRCDILENTPKITNNVQINTTWHEDVYKNEIPIPSIVPLLEIPVSFWTSDIFWLVSHLDRLQRKHTNNVISSLASLVGVVLHYLPVSCLNGLCLFYYREFIIILSIVSTFG